MAIKDQIGQIESKSEPSSGKQFEHYAGPTYQGISEYTKEERKQSVQDSARFASDGVVGNLHLVQADQQPQQQQQQQSEYRPTPRQLRDAIAKRGQSQPAMPDCDWRPQSAEVAPIKNTCGVDLEKKVPEAEKSVVQVINLDKGLGNGVYACKSDGSFCGVITNDHVVPEGSGPVLIQQGDKDALGQRVAGDPEHDLALLKMSGGNAAPEPAQFGDAPQRRDSVYALCRLQENTIVSTGLAMEPSINMGTEGSSPTPSIGSLQVTFHGCSGTANFNKAGKIVGIVKGGTTQSFDLGLTGSAFGSQAKDLIEGYKP